MMFGYFEESAHGNAISLILVFIADQLTRLLAASRIELIVRRLYSRMTS